MSKRPVCYCFDTDPHCAHIWWEGDGTIENDVEFRCEGVEEVWVTLEKSGYQ